MQKIGDGGDVSILMASLSQRQHKYFVLQLLEQQQQQYQN
jgi:hypothetical protein